MPERQGKRLGLSRSIDNGVDFGDQSIMGPLDGLILPNLITDACAMLMSTRNRPVDQRSDDKNQLDESGIRTQ
ncbi:MAG: hypothetical protein SOH81_05610 [Acetobacter sp.]